MRDTRGMALIEIILIIGIISILLLIPLLKGNMLLSHKERKELREFVKDINYTRNRAIVESTIYSVNLRSADNSYIIIKHSSPEKTIKTKKFNNGIKIRNSAISNNEIKFTHSGTPSNPKTIYLEDKKRNPIKITIRPATGKVSIYYE